MDLSIRSAFFALCSKMTLPLNDVLSRATRSVVASSERFIIQQADAPPNSFEAACHPDSPAIVYCESCYNAEVS